MTTTADTHITTPTPANTEPGTAPGNGPTRVKTAIIGSGFAGLAMGIRLKRRGDEDFLIIERACDLGGTWRDNTYPGVACDVPSHLYSFSFRPNPDWTSLFSPGAEIQEYLRECAREEGLTPHFRFDAALRDATWNERTQRWELSTDGGEVEARYLIMATGHLADKHLPEVPGLEGFTGRACHSARWDPSIRLEGLRVGIVGTGASAIQLVPEAQQAARELVVFQRTPAWVIPRPVKEYTDGERRMFRRDPSAIRRVREELFWNQENTYPARRGIDPYLSGIKAMAAAHLAAQVQDEALREKLTPHYEPGCKRLLLSNTYYPAMAAENTTVEASALASVQGSTAVAASGARYDLDVLIFATGFEAAQPPFARLVHGLGGVNLAEHWSRGMRAMDSTAVAGYPNLFSINGPNTSLGHNSIVYIIESQVEYILGAMDWAAEHDDAVLTPIPEREEEYVAQIDRKARGSVWTDGGCDSWYLDPGTGRLTLIWPDFGYAFRETNGTFHPERFELLPDRTTAAA